MFSGKHILAEDSAPCADYKLHPIFCFIWWGFFCAEAVDCFNCRNSEKHFPYKKKSSSGKHLKSAETQHFSWLLFIPYSIAQFPITDSNMSLDLTRAYVSGELRSFGMSPNLSWADKVKGSYITNL